MRVFLLCAASSAGRNAHKCRAAAARTIAGWRSGLTVSLAREEKVPSEAIR